MHYIEIEEHITKQIPVPENVDPVDYLREIESLYWEDEIVLHCSDDYLYTEFSIISEEE